MVIVSCQPGGRSWKSYVMMGKKILQNPEPIIFLTNKQKKKKKKLQSFLQCYCEWMMICTVTQMLLYLCIDIMFMHPALSALSSFSCNRSYIYWNSYSNCDFHPTHSVSFCPIRSILYGPVLINSWVCALKWTLRGLLSVSWSMWGEEAFEWIRRGWVCRRAWVTECVL